MKHREQRNKVLAKARMQCGARWQDVAILNYSAHGLGLTCEDPPPRGTFIEVRRGPFVIIARVAWTKGHRFGVRTQDPVASVAILSNASQSRSAQPAQVFAERRSIPRPPTRQIPDASRHQGRLVEFVSIALVLAAGAALIAETAYAQLSSSFDKVGSALSVSGDRAGLK